MAVAARPGNVPCGIQIPDQTGRLMRHVRAARWYAAACAIVLICLCGCSDPEESNYVSEQVGKLVVDRPRAWTTEVPVEQPWSKGYRLVPESVEQIQVSGDFGEFSTASQAMGTLIGQAQVGLQKFHVVQSRDVTIKGATTGRVTRYTIIDNAGSQLSGEWFVAAHWPYPQSVAVSILTPQFDPDLERRILESMELRPVLK
jgi:hypothetical protein